MNAAAHTQSHAHTTTTTCRPQPQRAHKQTVKHNSTQLNTTQQRNEVYLSNRSAAYAALERWQPALDDAAAAARLKPRWVKGHARMAAALMGLKRYGEAREAYEAALRLEPDDASLQRGRDRATAMEMQQARDGKHTFASKRAKTVDGAAAAPPAAAAGGSGGSGRGGVGASGSGDGGGSGRPPQQQQQQQQQKLKQAVAAAAPRPPAAAAKRDTRVLSFAADDEDEEGGG